MESNTVPVWPGWETVRLIGRGSSGAVYEIERDVFGEKEKAALKRITIPADEDEIAVLRSEGETSESITGIFRGQMERFIDEYKLMRRLDDCPYVVRVDDVDCVQRDSGLGWDIRIKMELLTPLLSWLGEEITVPEEDVIRLGTQMCRALTECAKYSILHRDIKPQNIFVSKNGFSSWAISAWPGSEMRA